MEGGAADKPFTMSLEIHGNHPGKIQSVVKLNFDLRFNKKWQSSIDIGNMQGKDSLLVKRFKTKIKENPLDFFIESCKQAFPGKDWVRARNVKDHAAYRRPNNEMVFSSMQWKNKLTQEQATAYIEHHIVGSRKSRKGREAARLVKAEMRRIIRDGTGMHKAAFKKAGFVIKRRKKFWHMK